MKKSTLKRITRKTLSISMAMMFATGCIFATGCDGVYKNVKETQSGDASKIKKPETIRVLVDGTVVSDEEGTKKFEEYLEGLLASYGDPGTIDLDIVGPKDSRYYDMYNGDWKPDVMLLTSDYYTLYAASDMLWDMTEAWENSKTKQSGRVLDGAKDIISNLYVRDLEGNEAMYGFSPYRGNGCCTYVKAEWLERAGIDKSTIVDKTLSFEEYYAMLKKMKASSKSDFVISPPGFISTEYPYTNYLPEFYQDAWFDFYKDDKGKYVDGFVQQEMIDALTRIQTAVSEGIINKNATQDRTSKAQDYFCSTDPKEESGVFSYWSGNWGGRLKSRIKGALRADGTTMSGELIAIKPVAELGEYVERHAPVWCINKDCKNPEGVYKYFIDSMLDGGDIQMAWQYGVKGVHWDDDSQDFSVNHIPPLLTIAPMENDIGMNNMPEFMKESAKVFSDNSVLHERLPMTEEYGTHMADINQKRRTIINKVALDPSYSAEQGIKDYKVAVGSLVDTVLKSLNKLEE